MECWSILSEPSKALDSSLKRHTALIKRMRQSAGVENRDQILKDVDSLSLEKYVDEIIGAAAEGMLRCKTEKDVWSAVEVSLKSLGILMHDLSTRYMLLHRSYLLYIADFPRRSHRASSHLSPLPLRHHPAPRLPHSPQNSEKRKTQRE